MATVTDIPDVSTKDDLSLAAAAWCGGNEADDEDVQAAARLPTAKTPLSVAFSHSSSNTDSDAWSSGMVNCHCERDAADRRPDKHGCLSAEAFSLISICTHLLIGKLSTSQHRRLPYLTIIDAITLD